MNQKKQVPLVGKSRRAVVARFFLGAAVFTLPARAEVDQELEKIVVSALRVPRAASDVTSTVTVLDPAELQRKGIFQLRDALNEAPGVISLSTGGETGALGTLLIRGTTTAYSQLVVDGMRLSDSTTPLGSMLGASRVSDLGRIEVLRGAQGAAYGGESIGGVLWMETARGRGDASYRLFAEMGSFESYSTAFQAQGEQHGLSYFFSAAYEQTQNDAPHQDFHQGSTALRLEQSIGKEWQIGLTYRGVDSYYDSFGNSDDRLDASLTTLYAQGKISPDWFSTVHLGFQQEFYDSDSTHGNYGTDMRALGFSNDHQLELTDHLKILGGVFYHRSDFQNTIGTDANRERYGVHASIEWQAAENWQTYAALRWEDYAAYGKESTWRIGTSYAIPASDTLLRAGLGSSFRAPSYLDLYGSSFGQGNPQLNAESSLGWDLGIEQQLGAHHWLQVTAFRNELEDRIDSFATPRPINLRGETQTQGVELAAKGRLLIDDLSYRLAYTWLDRSISDQPRHHVQASVDWQASDKLSVGAGLHALSDHSWGGTALDSYALLRLHASYQLKENIRLHARWENVADAEYELSNFYGQRINGAGMGLFGGVTIDW